MSRVLVVEDEMAIAELIALNLRHAGFEVTVVDNGEDAQTQIDKVMPDLVLLDWMLPGQSGLTLAKRWRGATRTRDIPIIMLTARAQEADKVAGLDAGADDYLTKPFALPELEVRLDALVLRAQGRNPRRRLQVADLVLDLATLEAQRAGQALRLYPACRKLLEVLMRASPAAVTRQQLEFALWGDELPDGDLLRSHIYELRRSVDGPFQQKLIHTLPRVGYRLGVSAADSADETA